MPLAATFGSRESWLSSQSGEYASDHLVPVEWRSADLLVFLQLHDTVLFLSCQGLLISRSLLLPTLLAIFSFNRAVHHSFPLHFIHHSRYKRIPSITLIEPWHSSHYWHLLPL
jgi:hypothetical protein